MLEKYLLKGVLHRLPEININFVLCLKIIDTCFWKTIFACLSKLSKELKNGFEIVVDQVLLIS